MPSEKHDRFFQFARKYRYKFYQISRATRQEYEVDDVQNEAWVMITEFELEQQAIDYENPDDMDRLFRCLYVKLVYRKERKIRNAIRLDHYSRGENPEHDVHPLMNFLSAPESSQPLEALLELEASAALPSEPGPHISREAAYLMLVRHYKNNMKDVADHLLISRSYCYYRFNEAVQMAQNQNVLSSAMKKQDGTFFPRPWRSFRLSRHQP